MEKKTKEQLQKYHPNLDSYDKEIKVVEDFFTSKGYGLMIETDEVFWNHMISLIQRMDDNSLNEMEVDIEIDEIFYDNANELIALLKEVREVTITEFELFLLAIYFQKFKEDLN